jgi:tRNA pseudouridine32 synthase/23S rRNA pseudouridine746 synthase
MKIAFENARLVAIDKPAGWLSVPSRMGEQDARKVAGLELERALGTRLFPIHRLDFDVSGLLLFAKDAEAHRAGNEAFEKRLVRKTYQAYSGPGVAPVVGTQTWRSLLVRGKKRSFEAPHGAEAVTEAEWLGELRIEESIVWHWRLSPHTGRAHQLRVHLAAHAAPILGDALYGSKAVWTRGGIALRALELDARGAPKLLELGLPERLSVPGF